MAPKRIAQQNRQVGGSTATVRVYAPRWLAAQARRLSPRTVELYAEICRVHVLPALGDIPLPWLRREDVRAFLVERLTVLKPKTVETIYGCLSSLCQSAVDDGVLLANPCRGAGRHLWPRVEPIPKALLPDEVTRLLRAAQGVVPRHHDAFLVLARAGVRLGELLALAPAAVDRVGRTLRVERTWHSREKRFGPPKGGRPRTVDLSHEALEALERRRQGGAVLLFSKDDVRPYTKDAVEKAFRQATTAAGLPGYLTPHCLRHTYASTLLSLGAPIQYVAAQLGHASLEITVATYGSWLHASRHDLVDLLDAPPHKPPHRALARREELVRGLRRRVD